MLARQIPSCFPEILPVNQVWVLFSPGEVWELAEDHATFKEAVHSLQLAQTGVWGWESVMVRFNCQLDTI